MLPWLLRLLLAGLVLRLFLKAGGNSAPERRPFDPRRPRHRANSRGPHPFDGAEVEDADFEEIPYGRR